MDHRVHATVVLIVVSCGQFKI